MQHHDLNKQGRKGLFGLHFHITVPQQRKLGQEFKQGRAAVDAEAMQGAAYCLAPRSLLSLLSCRAQDHQPRGSTTHDGLGPPSPITKVNALRACLGPILWRYFLN